MEIDGRQIGNRNPVYVIAEMSANHDQKFDKAVALIYAAKKAGADAIKLQTYTADTLVGKNDHRMSTGLWADQTLYDLYTKAYMPWEWQPKLKKLADDIGITLFSTAYDITSVDFLETMDVPAYKVASYELTHLPLIEYIASKGKPMIISTGLASDVEIDIAVRSAYSAWKRYSPRYISLLKCTSQYPALPGDMNLKVMSYLRGRFNVPIGLSDHSKDRVIPIAAVAVGACIIEKHITLSRDSVDGAFSLLPEEFAQMVQDIRITEKAMGNKIGPTESEKQMLPFRWDPKTGKRGL